MIRRDGSPSPRMGSRRAARLFASLLAFGIVVMLFTVAVGAGDTSVGNSNEPWVAGDVILFGVPVAIGAWGYWLLRSTGVLRRRALVLSGAAAIAVPILVFGAFLVLALVMS